MMSFIFYKIIYKTYNCFLFFALNFKKGQFQVSKFRRAFMTLTFCVYAGAKMTVFPVILGEMIKSMELSTFALVVTYGVNFSILFATLAGQGFLLYRQEEISKMLTIFCSLRKVCDETVQNLNFKKIETKSFRIFSFYFFLLLLEFYIHIFQIKSRRELNLKIIAYLVIEMIQTFLRYGLQSINQLILTHYDEMMELAEITLENQLNQIHNDCEEVLIYFKAIQKLFDKLNKTFKELFASEILTCFSFLMLRVNFLLKFSNMN